MRCSTTIATLGAGLMACVLAAPAAAADFRAATWGMSRQAVKQSEPRSPVQEGGDALFFRARVAGMDAVVVYQFSGDALYRCAYLIGSGYSDYEPAVADYEAVKDHLVRKYGVPVDERFSWARESVQGRYPPGAYDQAIALGHLHLNARWEHGAGTVGLMLARGAPNARRLTIAYEDPARGASAGDRHAAAGGDF